jgi:hypothetical protein
LSDDENPKIVFRAPLASWTPKTLATGVDKAVEGHAHGLRGHLSKLFTLPFIALGLPFISTSTTPASRQAPAAAVQQSGMGSKKSIEEEMRDKLIRANQLSHGNPEYEAQRRSLTEAIEKTLEIHEHLLDQDEAVEKILDAYVEIERKRGRLDNDIAQSLARIREWLNPEPPLILL